MSRPKQAIGVIRWRDCVKCGKRVLSENNIDPNCYSCYKTYYKMSKKHLEMIKAINRRLEMKGGYC